MANAGCSESSVGIWAEGGMGDKVLGQEQCGDFAEQRETCMWLARVLEWYSERRGPSSPNKRLALSQEKWRPVKGF